MKLLKYIHTLATVALLAACSDSDEPMPADADDNFITAFSLTKDGLTYPAEINGEDMTITVPYTVDLDGATASVTYTPSAKILPDPATVHDWNNERVFRVVSYSGKSREYTYLLNRADISQCGDVTLASQSEIDAFGESGINVIEGNLTIGSDAGEIITDLSPLSTIKEVKGTVIILNSFEGNDLTGLDRMRSMGGLQIGTVEKPSSSPIEVVTIHKATEITGDIEIVNNNTSMVIAEKLETVGGSISVTSSSLQSIQLETLSTVAGDLKINGINKAGITNFMLPLLTSVVGEISVRLCPNLTTFIFPKLQKTGSVSLEKVPFEFETISLPELIEVAGDFTLTSFFAYQPIGSSYDFNTVLTKIDGLTKLTKIGGTFRLEDFAGLEMLPDFSHAAIHAIYLSRCPKLPSSINLSASSFLTEGNTPAYIYMNKVPTTTILGQSEMDCDFVLFGNTYTFQNVSKIGSLVISGGQNETYTFSEIYRDLNIKNRGTLSFPNLTRIGRYMLVDGTTDFDFPRLKEIVGEVYVPQKTSVWKFPELTSICATSTDFDKIKYISLLESFNNNIEGLKAGWGLYMELGDNEKINLDKLQYIGGNGWHCNLYYSKKSWTSFGLPVLKTVKGCLEIVSLPNADTKLTELTFPALTSADKVFIKNFKKLNDFSTFSGLFKNNSIKSIDDWTIQYCGYNPTYQDMVDGKYSK